MEGKSCSKTKSSPKTAFNPFISSQDIPINIAGFVQQRLYCLPCVHNEILDNMPCLFNMPYFYY